MGRFFIMEKVFLMHPPNIGWLQAELSSEEIEHLWKCVERKKDNLSNTLAGNIDSSYVLEDDQGFFFTNTLSPLIRHYLEVHGKPPVSLVTKDRHGYRLESFWVNYQKQTEFNPAHTHEGVWSFVVWMKIPTHHTEQTSLPFSANSNHPVASAFQFLYSDTLGNIKSHIIEMNPDMEGQIVFFPSRLTHQVYPFYNCEDDRITISGNIGISFY